MLIAFGLAVGSSNTVTIGGYTFPVNNVTSASNIGYVGYTVPAGASYSHVSGGTVTVSELR